MITTPEWKIELLRSAIVDQGLAQEAAAKMAGVSEATACRLARRFGWPKKKRVIQKIQPREFIGLAPQTPPMPISKHEKMAQAIWEERDALYVRLLLRESFERGLFRSAA